MAAFADGPTTIRNVGFIRHKETDRIAAPVAELRRCGIDARETDDGIVIVPGTVHRRAVIETYDDHRMAMAFALLGLRGAGHRDRRSRMRGQDLPRLLGPARRASAPGTGPRARAV